MSSLESIRLQFEILNMVFSFTLTITRLFILTTKVKLTFFFAKYAYNSSYRTVISAIYILFQSKPIIEPTLFLSEGTLEL